MPMSVTVQSWEMQATKHSRLAELSGTGLQVSDQKLAVSNLHKISAYFAHVLRFLDPSVQHFGLNLM